MDNLADYLKEVERALSRMRSEIRAQELFIELLLKAASGSIEENREAILTALWIAHAERTETHGEDDDIARFLAKFSARLDAALTRTPQKTTKRGTA
jgi:cell division protein ZapA (FtsZ GTPase activity inhibitor)